MTDTKLADMLDRALDAAAREFKDRTADLDLLAAKWADIIDTADRAEALRWIVGETISSLVAVNCLLDETESSSYVVEAEITAKLTEAIIAQGRTTTALIELAGERIQAHARMLTVLAGAHT